MKIALFYHSLVSDWNNGNAHFLRGIAWELRKRRHEVAVFEPARGWSLTHLLEEYGSKAVHEFHRAYPGLDSIPFDSETLDLDCVLSDADLVMVHEWNEHDLVRRIGAHRNSAGCYRLLFHDTHHRSVTEAGSVSSYDLSGYDGVLAYGRAIAGVYLSRGWARRAWIWHEAADARVFQPLPDLETQGDVVWIGNWADGERTAELHEFFLEPVKALGLKARVYGVRYPPDALEALSRAGVEYGGWLPNYLVPEAFARFRATVHIPRRPYVRALPGVPTIRPFEALACAIPLVSSPWEDTDELFTPGEDYLIAGDGAEMKRILGDLLSNPEKARALAARGRETILKRHTCAHRVDELLRICGEIEPPRCTGRQRPAQPAAEKEHR